MAHLKRDVAIMRATPISPKINLIMPSKMRQTNSHTFIVFVFINVSSLNRILNFVKALNGRI